MHQFHVGDRVRVIDRTSIHYGTECTVIRELTECWRIVTLTGVREFVACYRVDIKPTRSDCEGVAYTAAEIIPVYDGNELVAWEDCVWQPIKEIV